MYPFCGMSFGLALPTSFGQVLPNSISLLTSSFFAAFFVKTLVISSAILSPIKSLVASVVFWIDLFDAVFIASDFLTLSRTFWPYLLLKFLPMFFAKDENPYLFTYVISLGSIEHLIFIFFI